MEASRLRLRPILMTSFAFILGVVPLVIATGAGAEMRRSLGTAVFSGMIGVTLFGIFLTPVFFYVIQGLSELRFFTGRHGAVARLLAVRRAVRGGGRISAGAARDRRRADRQAVRRGASRFGSAADRGPQELPWSIGSAPAWEFSSAWRSSAFIARDQALEEGCQP